MSRRSAAGGLDAGWRLPSLVDYYDFDRRVLVEQPARLEALDDEDRAVALSIVQGVVADRTSAMDDELLAGAAVSVVEDLYKAGSFAEQWGPLHRSYVGAVWGTFFAVLSARGYAMRYVVENTYPDSLDRPIVLFPDLFGAAGLKYVCPHQVATRLPEAEVLGHTLEGLRPLLGEARELALHVTDAVVMRNEHLAYLEIDFDEGCLDGIMGLPRAPGVISVLRNEAPLPGTNVQVAIEPRV